MRNSIIVIITVASLILYFGLTVFVLPGQFLKNEQLFPSPYFDVEISSQTINLGDSFRIKIESENRGDYGDIHIISTAFPTIQAIDNIVRIVSYDFSHTPVIVEVGDQIGASYTGGVQTIYAQYPSIEAMNRPVPKNSTYTMELLITPQEIGDFLIYVKAVGIPHVSDESHYPQSGVLDHQNEYVKEFSITVNP